MRELLDRLMLEPVFFVGTALAVVTGLTADGIIAGPWAVATAVVLTALLRQLVAPAKKGADIFTPALDDPTFKKGKR